MKNCANENCLYALPIDAKFCLKCGTAQLAKFCTECGFQFPGMEKFCPDCGNKR
jgi:RNA polymerase subunit RPABC4/transcription elongation factor Spt4